MCHNIRQNQSHLLAPQLTQYVALGKLPKNRILSFLIYKMEMIRSLFSVP